MKTFRFDKVALPCAAFRRPLPFKFRGKTSTRPIRVSVGFEIAQVSDRFRLVNRPEARQRKIPPFAVTFRPVERRLPALLVNGGPAKGKPIFRTPVAA